MTRGHLVQQLDGVVSNNSSRCELDQNSVICSGVTNQLIICLCADLSGLQSIPLLWGKFDLVYLEHSLDPLKNEWKKYAL